MEASHRRESLKMASDHSGGPCQVRGRKTSAEWRAATWRIGPQWGVCRGLGDLKPPHSILRCLFMPLARSPVLCLCSYSEQVGWVTQLLCSGLSLAISPFSSSSCSLPPLFFLPSPFYFPLIRLSISTVSPGPSVHFRCSDGQISTDWVSGEGGDVERRRNRGEEWGSERSVSCFRCCSCWLPLCLCLICWGFTFATVTMQVFVQSGFLFVLLFCFFSWYSRWTTTSLLSPFCVSKMSTFSFDKTHVAQILRPWCVRWRKSCVWNAL